jgi:SAM-dependent methyltransferase
LLPEEWGRARNFKVTLNAREESVTIVYEFWPRTYTHVVRTRVVAARDGATIDVDMRNEDDLQPDRIVAGKAPTPLAVVERMCKLAGISPDDVVLDIGCGDGRMVRTAVAKFGAKKGIGIDIDPAQVELSRQIAAAEGLKDKIEFRPGDALKLESLDDATVVMLYVGEHLNMKLRPILKKYLRSGARIVSHEFDMGDWLADRTEAVTTENIFGKLEEMRIHLWVIP